jgi:four helix bundle protein
MMNDECGMMNDRRGDDLKKRTKQFALRIIRVYASLEKDAISQVLGKQLLRSGTSVGAHYREAGRARSTKEFISKLEGGIQELDETLYWLELLVEGEIVSASRLDDLMHEANELLAILVASAKTAKKHT